MQELRMAECRYRAGSVMQDRLDSLTGKSLAAAKTTEFDQE